MTKNITLFPELTKPGNAHVKTLDSTLKAIKDPNATVKTKIEKIRGTQDKSLREDLKKELPVICFGGTFTERRASALVEYSKIICLDFDEIECLEDLEEELKAKIDAASESIAQWAQLDAQEVVKEADKGIDEGLECPEGT